MNGCFQANILAVWALPPRSPKLSHHFETLADDPGSSPLGYGP